MPLYLADCPRCRARNATFDTFGQISRGVTHAWVERFEIFGVCRSCHKASILVAENSNYDWAPYARHQSQWLSHAGYLNDHVRHQGYINIKDNSAGEPPEHLPADIERVYREGLTCLAVECWNAAGAMFRTCIDLATKGMLPPEGTDPPAKVRRSLGLRLEWLFENGKLPVDLKDLAEAVQQDGNDGAHDASLSRDDALDLDDFTEQLLTRLFTEPGRLDEAKKRRIERRAAR